MKRTHALYLFLVVNGLFLVTRCSSSEGVDSSAVLAATDDDVVYDAATFITQPADTIYFDTSGDSTTNTFEVGNFYSGSTSYVLGYDDTSSDYSLIFYTSSGTIVDDETTITLEMQDFDSSDFTADTTFFSGIQIEIESPSDSSDSDGLTSTSDSFVVAVTLATISSD